VHEDGGKNPVWGNVFELPVTNMSDEIMFKIMDSDTFSDDTVGAGYVTVG